MKHWLACAVSAAGLAGLGSSASTLVAPFLAVDSGTCGVVTATRLPLLRTLVGVTVTSFWALTGASQSC